MTSGWCDGCAPRAPTLSTQHTHVWHGLRMGGAGGDISTQGIHTRVSWLRKGGAGGVRGVEATCDVGGGGGLGGLGQLQPQAHHTPDADNSTPNASDRGVCVC